MSKEGVVFYYQSHAHMMLPVWCALHGQTVELFHEQRVCFSLKGAKIMMVSSEEYNLPPELLQTYKYSIMIKPVSDEEKVFFFCDELMFKRWTKYINDSVEGKDLEGSSFTLSQRDSKTFQKMSKIKVLFAGAEHLLHDEIGTIFNEISLNTTKEGNVLMKQKVGLKKKYLPVYIVVSPPLLLIFQSQNDYKNIKPFAILNLLNITVKLSDHHENTIILQGKKNLFFKTGFDNKKLYYYKDLCCFCIEKDQLSSWMTIIKATVDLVWRVWGAMMSAQPFDPSLFGSVNESSVDSEEDRKDQQNQTIPIIDSIGSSRMKKTQKEQRGLNKINSFDEVVEKKRKEDLEKLKKAKEELSKLEEEKIAAEKEKEEANEKVQKLEEEMREKKIEIEKLKVEREESFRLLKGQKEQSLCEIQRVEQEKEKKIKEEVEKAHHLREKEFEELLKRIKELEAINLENEYNKDEIKKKCLEISNIQEEKEELILSIQEIKEENEKRIKEIKNLQENKEENVRIFEEMKKEIEEREKELIIERKQEIELQNEVQRITNKSNNDVEKLTNQIEVLQKEINNQRSLLQEIEEKNKFFNNEIKEAKIKEQQTKEFFTEEMNQITKKGEEERNRIMKENVIMKEEIEKLNKEKEEINEKYNKKEIENEGDKEKLKNEIQKREEIENDKTSLQNQIFQLKKIIEELEEGNNSNTNKINVLTEECSKKDIEIENIKKEFEQEIKNEREKQIKGKEEEIIKIKEEMKMAEENYKNNISTIITKKDLEIYQLKEEEQNKEKEIDILTNQKEIISNELITKKEENEILKEKINETLKELKEKEESNNQYQQINEEMKEKLKEKENEIKIKEEKITNKEKEMEELKNNCNKLEKENEKRFKEKINELNKEIEEQKKNIKNIKEEEYLFADIILDNEEIKELKEEMIHSKLNRKMIEFIKKKEMEQLINDKKDLEIQLSKYQIENQKIKNQNDELKKINQTKENEKVLLNEINEILQNKINELKEKDKIQEDENNKLQSEITNYSKTITSLTEKIELCKTENTKIENKIQQKENEIEEIKKEKEIALEELNYEIKKKIKDFENQIKEQEIIQNNQIITIKEKDQNIYELKQNIEKMKKIIEETPLKEHEEENNKILKLKEENELLENKNKENIQKIEVLKKKEEELNNKIQLIEQEKINLNKEINIEIQKLKEELENEKNEKEKMKDFIKQKEIELQKEKDEKECIIQQKIRDEKEKINAQESVRKMAEKIVQQKIEESQKKNILESLEEEKRNRKKIENEKEIIEKDKEIMEKNINSLKEEIEELKKKDKKKIEDIKLIELIKQPTPYINEIKKDTKITPYGSFILNKIFPEKQQISTILKIISLGLKSITSLTNIHLENVLICFLEMLIMKGEVLKPQKGEFLRIEYHGSNSQIVNALFEVVNVDNYITTIAYALRGKAFKLNAQAKFEWKQSKSKCIGKLTSKEWFIKGYIEDKFIEIIMPPMINGRFNGDASVICDDKITINVHHGKACGDNGNIKVDVILKENKIKELKIKVEGEESHGFYAESEIFCVPISLQQNMEEMKLMNPVIIAAENGSDFEEVYNIIQKRYEKQLLELHFIEVQNEWKLKIENVNEKNLKKTYEKNGIIDVLPESIDKLKENELINVLQSYHEQIKTMGENKNDDIKEVTEEYQKKLEKMGTILQIVVVVSFALMAIVINMMLF
ncbi:hypothetical protein ENUP19_0003G0016 [Entamoeba nuttalli]